MNSPKLQLVDKPEVVYPAALALVTVIDANLKFNTQHYRTRSGRLLRTLDQVVNAILADDLVVGDDALDPARPMALAA